MNILKEVGNVYYTPEETAKKLGVVSSTIRKMIKKGEIYAIKEKGRFFIPEKVIQDLLKKPKECPRCGKLTDHPQITREYLEGLEKYLESQLKKPEISKLLQDIEWVIIKLKEDGERSIKNIIRCFAEERIKEVSRKIPTFRGGGDDGSEEGKDSKNRRGNNQRVTSNSRKNRKIE